MKTYYKWIRYNKYKPDPMYTSILMTNIYAIDYTKYIEDPKRYMFIDQVRVSEEQRGFTAFNTIENATAYICRIPPMHSEVKTGNILLFKIKGKPSKEQPKILYKTLLGEYDKTILPEGSVILDELRFVEDITWTLTI